MKKAFYFITIALLCTLAYYEGVHNDVSFVNKAITSLTARKLPAALDNALAEKFLPKHFWLHRTNSTNKLDQFFDKYNGFELDIIYYEDQHAFENSHDKISLTEFSLEKQFAYFKNKNITTPSLWLDFKNLSERNSTAALNDLTKLLNDYQLSKENIWIESSTYQALSIFKNAGYKTSYYFPYYEFSKMSTEEIDAAKKTYRRNITFSKYYSNFFLWRIL